MAYQQLVSEKLVAESFRQELKAVKRQRNREAVANLWKFVFTSAVIIGVGYAVATMPTWMPEVTGFLQHYGVIPTPMPEAI